MLLRGAMRTPVTCNDVNLRKVSNALRNSKSKIETCDYKKILLDKTREDDFIYLDPPYSPISDTAYFTSYTLKGFTDRDQEELANVLQHYMTENVRPC
jgi:DNA adenine methylase